MSGFDLDLSGVESLVEGMMKDTCKITRTVNDKDRNWNPETSTYEEADPAVIYEGQCNIWSSKRGAYVVAEGGVSVRISTYYVEIPRDSDRPRSEDNVRILSVNDQANPQMVDLEMRVASLDLYSYSVSLIIRCEIREQVPE